MNTFIKRELIADVTKRGHTYSNILPSDGRVEVILEILKFVFPKRKIIKKNFQIG